MAGLYPVNPFCTLFAYTPVISLDAAKAASVQKAR
jgi:hypothetical protein